MEKVDVFMSLYVGDYLRDTAHLSCEEHGAYSRLLFNMWGQHGRLPFDHARLARITGTSRKAWERIWPVICEFFEVDKAAGSITQKRLAAELEKAQLRKAAAAENGRRGAEVRRSGALATLPATLPGSLPATLTATPPADGQRNGNSSTSSGSSPAESESKSPAAARSDARAGDPSSTTPVPPAAASRPNWRSGQEWLRVFGLAWRDAKDTIAYGSGGDSKAAGDLGDRVLAQLTDEAGQALWDKRAVLFQRYLAVTDRKVAEANHPFALFVSRFSDYLPDVAPGSRAPPGRNVAVGWAAPSTDYGTPGDQKL